MGFVAYRRSFFGPRHGLAGAQPVEHFERLIHERWAEDSSIGAHELGQSRRLPLETLGFVAAIREAD